MKDSTTLKTLNLENTTPSKNGIQIFNFFYCKPILMQVKIEKDALSLLHCLSVISPLNFNSINFFFGLKNWYMEPLEPWSSKWPLSWFFWLINHKYCYFGGSSFSSFWVWWVLVCKTYYEWHLLTLDYILSSTLEKNFWKIPIWNFALFKVITYCSFNQ